MGEQTGRRVYKDRLRWLPLVWTAGMLGLIAVGAGAMPGRDPSHESEYFADLGRPDVLIACGLAAGFLLVYLLRSTWGWRLGVSADEGGLVLSRWLRPPLKLAWDDIEAVSTDARGLWVSGAGAQVRISRRLHAWRDLAAVVEAHATLLAAPEPLGARELAAWLGEPPLRLWAWRPATQTFLPLLALGGAAGAIVIALLSIGDRWASVDVETVAGGALVGLVFMAAPALVVALPMVVRAEPRGLMLSGLTRWRARRAWIQVATVRTGVFGWRLVTDRETLLFLTSPASARLRRAAEQVLAARREGRVLAWEGELPGGALSRADRVTAEAERGLSAAGEPGAG